jgi:hypothetical protein
MCWTRPERLAAGPQFWSSRSHWLSVACCACSPHFRIHSSTCSVSFYVGELGLERSGSSPTSARSARAGDVAGIRARMSELAPVVAEYERLQAACAALAGPGTGFAAGGRRAPATRAGRDTSARRGRGRSPLRPSRPRPPRGQNKAAVLDCRAAADPYPYQRKERGVGQAQLARSPRRRVARKPDSDRDRAI